MDVEKSQRVSSFTFSGIVRFFKRNRFRVKIRFSQAQHAISDFCFLKKDRRFFYVTFLKFCFTEAPPQFLPETKHFARVKDSSRFLGTMRLTGDHQKYFRENFSSISCFLRFFVEKDGFFAVLS